MLEYLHKAQQPSFHVVNLFGGDELRGYSGATQAATEAITEGITWLVAQGLLVPKLDQAANGWYQVSRRGRLLQTGDQVKAYRAAAIFPDELLHHAVVTSAKDSFLRGHYDTAVFEAFREVEVAVRDAGAFGLADYGVKLMRNAFRETGGPLTDSSAPPAEQEALANLFVGAIGRCPSWR